MSSDRLFNEGFTALKRGDLVTTFARQYELATKDPTSRNGGVTSTSLGDSNLKAGKVVEAEGWYRWATQSKDGPTVAIAHQRLAALAIRRKDMKTETQEFLLAKDRDQDITETMLLSAARCCENIAQANPKLRREYKEQANSYLAQCVSDQAKKELFGNRMENLCDAKVRANDPTDLTYALHPSKDDFYAFEADARVAIALATDQEAKATIQLMLMEVYHDFLSSPEQVKDLGREINLNWRDHRKQAAWARLVWGGALQDQGRNAEAIAMYGTIITDFTDADNFARNDVRGLAGRLIAICKGRMAKK